MEYNSKISKLILNAKRHVSAVINKRLATRVYSLCDSPPQDEELRFTILILDKCCRKIYEVKAFDKNVS